MRKEMVHAMYIKYLKLVIYDYDGVWRSKHWFDLKKNVF